MKEGTSAVLLQSSLDEKWLADSMERYCYLRRVQAKNVYKLKKEDNATFYSLSEEWVMPAASTINSEERGIEFVVDSGASMHMVSKKDLNKADLETVRISKNPTMVMTASGKVLAKEEATSLASSSQ